MKKREYRVAYRWYRIAIGGAEAGHSGPLCRDAKRDLTAMQRNDYQKISRTWAWSQRAKWERENGARYAPITAEYASRNIAFSL